MDALSPLACHSMAFLELAMLMLGTYITTRVSAGWCVDRSLLSIMCVGSSPSIIAFPRGTWLESSLYRQSMARGSIHPDDL